MSEKMNNLRIIFMGTPRLSAEILRSLLDANYDIVGVFTQPDKRVGRKQSIEKSPVKILAEENAVPVFTPTRLDEIAIEKIRELKPDLIILIAYGKILPQAVLELPRFGAINIHPSLLPKFRGPSPIQNTLLNGEKTTGTTIMKMDPGIDTGDMLAQEKTNIDTDDTYVELEQKLLNLSAKLLLNILPQWVNGEIAPQKQDNSEASYCQMINGNDGKINWNDSTGTIYNKYKAFIVWPGIFTHWTQKDKTRRIKLNAINIGVGDEKHPVGKVFLDDKDVAVQAKDGKIILKMVQLEGKPTTTAKDFINGHPNFLDSILN